MLAGFCSRLLPLVTRGNSGNAGRHLDSAERLRTFTKQLRLVPWRGSTDPEAAVVGEGAVCVFRLNLPPEPVAAGEPAGREELILANIEQPYLSTSWLEGKGDCRGSVLSRPQTWLRNRADSGSVA